MAGIAKTPTPMVDLKVRDAARQADLTRDSDGLELVRQKVAGNRDARLRVASKTMLDSAARGESALPPDDFARFKKAIGDAESYDRIDQALERLAREARSRAATISVLHEERTYGPANPHRSYFVDLADHLGGVGTMNGATARIERHAIEVGVEMRRGTSAEARRARRAFREHWRGGGKSLERARADLFDDEQRAMSSAGSSGGALVTPSYVVSEWASFRGANRSFADQCRPLPLPDHGVVVYVPEMTGGAQIAAQTENQGVVEADPTSGYLQSAVVPLVGQVTISQQLHDRAGARGMGFDMVVGMQMREQLDAQIDSFALTQALANAGTVAGAATYTTGGLYNDIGKARAAMQDTAGTRLKATHTFVTPDFWAYVTSQVDAQGRPIVTPAFTAAPWAGLVAAGDPKGLGWTGHVLPSGLAAFEDGNIPASGANTQIVVSRPQTVLLWEGDPIPYSYAESLAGTLSVIVGLRAYVACVPRYPKATQTITGAAYSSSLI